VPKHWPTITSMPHSLDTAAVHAGRSDLTALGVHALPIDLSSTNPLPGVAAGGDSYEVLATGGRCAPGQSPVYQRLWNPTVARLEEGIAELEGTQEAIAFASGMAALSAVLLAIIQRGTPHVVAVRPLYGGSDHLLGMGLLGTTVTFATPELVRESLQPETGLVILETPANPTLDLVDIRQVVADAGDVPVLVDSTFATPVLQNPTRLGASLVLHSATKFIGGHSDALGGLVAGDAEWIEALRRIRAITGGILNPMAAYLLHRGLPTLPIRVRAQQASAALIAGHLASHPAVARVLHPSLPGADPRGLLGTQMAGPGSILALELRGGFQVASRVAESLSLITHAVSLGGVDTLIQHPAALTHRPVPPEARPSAGLLRLSVGLESVDDLLADLDQALATAAADQPARRAAAHPVGVAP
jgi:cystathionine beta-lyase/cystathionine gamma-synthase